MVKSIVNRNTRSTSNTLTHAQMGELIEQLSRAKAILDSVYFASDSNLPEKEGLRDFRVERATAAAATFVEGAISTLIESEVEEARRHG